MQTDFVSTLHISAAVTPEELKKVEKIVNEQITNALAVVTKEPSNRGSKKDRSTGSVW